MSTQIAYPGLNNPTNSLYGSPPAPLPPPPPPPTYPYSNNQSYRNAGRSGANTHTQPNEIYSNVDNHNAKRLLQASFNAYGSDNVKHNFVEDTKQTYKCNMCASVDPNNPCDFPSPAALRAHTAAHTTCSAKECDFVASPKLVNAHYASKHGKYSGRGLKTVSLQIPGTRAVKRFKICVGNHPADVKDWIEERKRCYPRVRKMGDTTMMSDKNLRLKVEGGLGNIDDVRNKRSVESNPTGVDVTNSSKRPKSSGKHQENDKSSLGELMLGYTSSDNDDDSTGVVRSNSQEVHDGNQSNEIISNKEKKLCHFFLRNGTCKNATDCQYLHDIEAHKQCSANKVEKRKEQSERDRARNRDQKDMDVLSGRRNACHKGNSSVGAGGATSLLRKLLESDMERERSLTLQLLRYIVDCNYLQEKREV